MQFHPCFVLRLAVINSYRFFDVCLTRPLTSGANSCNECLCMWRVNSESINHTTAISVLCFANAIFPLVSAHLLSFGFLLIPAFRYVVAFQWELSCSIFTSEPKCGSLVAALGSMTPLVKYMPLRLNLWFSSSGWPVASIFLSYSRIQGTQSEVCLAHISASIRALQGKNINCFSVCQEQVLVRLCVL